VVVELIDLRVGRLGFFGEGVDMVADGFHFLVIFYLFRRLTGRELMVGLGGGLW
jgi:hypothetical protein